MIPKNFSGKLLDVPVGTAVFTIEKYKNLPNAEITCLDYSEEMLIQAKKRFSENNLKNINTLQGDVGKLPFTDGLFDIVLSMNGFPAFPDKNKAFLETHRILKKTGLFVLVFILEGNSKEVIL